MSEPETALQSFLDAHRLQTEAETWGPGAATAERLAAFMDNASHRLVGRLAYAEASRQDFDDNTLDYVDDLEGVAA